MTIRILILLLTVGAHAVHAESDTWPSFRGLGARGIATDQNLPDDWDRETGRNVAWQTPIPGLANSAPIIWKGRTFQTTAVSSTGTSSVKIGNYGAGEAANDDDEHSWRLYCLDTATGRVLWHQESHKGLPNVRRHTKSSHCNSTPATDGKHVVTLYNTGGLYCYTVDGELLWSTQLGLLDSGAFDVPELQWGFGSSPVIDNNQIIVQCDIQKGSFIAAYDIATGDEIWKSERDELPSWGTPTVHSTESGSLLIANGYRFVRGYDAGTGEELWRLPGNSFITVPTPFVAHDLIFVTSGYRPVQPIYAVRLNARGDLAESESIAWSRSRNGTYIPTPIVVDDYLYTLSGYGVLSCYEAVTGKPVYRQRVGNGFSSSFTASPVAADGRLYLTSESGHVSVVRAGVDFELLSEALIEEHCLATPAIGSGLLLFRTESSVLAIGRSPDKGTSLHSRTDGSTSN